MKKITLIIFGIVLLSGFLCLYKLDKVPPSLDWDEIAAGYNAYTIAHWGKDEWGKRFPLVFTSFRDDKHPVHIYLTAPIVGIFGLNDFNTRLSSALIGTASFLVVFVLAKYMFDSTAAGIFASLFLTLSPYHLYYSRGLWEANFALFFFLLGLMFFYLGIKKKSKYLKFSYLSFGLSLLSYHSSKIVAFPLVIFLTLLYLRKLISFKRDFYIGLAIFTGFLLVIIFNPRLLGIARVNQTKFSDEEVRNTQVYKKTSVYYLGYGEIAFNNWKKYFTEDYLFVKGDQNARRSIKVIGQFFWVDMILAPLGIVFLLFKKKREFLFLLAWVMLAPLPGALSSSTPHATRSIFLLGGVVLLSTYGVGFLLDRAGKIWLKVFIGLLIIAPVLYQSYFYLNYYFTKYSEKNAIEWQYGMKEIVKYVRNNKRYYQVYMVNIRQQPYIFFLYYLKTPLPQFLKTVKYDNSSERSFNTVSKYSKYHFGGWDVVESFPGYNTLYIVTPYNYTGLRRKNDFYVNKIVKYPNGGDAFYLVSGNE